MKRTNFFRIFILFAVIASLLLTSSCSALGMIMKMGQGQTVELQTTEPSPTPTATPEPEPTPTPDSRFGTATFTPATETPEPTVAPVQSEGQTLSENETYEVSTKDEFFQLVREASEQRLINVHVKLPSDVIPSSDRGDDLATQVADKAPLLIYVYFEWADDYNYCTYDFTLTYRPGVRIIDAVNAGDLSTLDEDERQALNIAQEVVDNVKSQYSDPIEIERQLDLYLRSHVTYDYMNEDLTVISDVVKGTNALLYGTANCQGYSDAFYILGSLAGLTIGYQYGTIGGEEHLWNTIQINGKWYTEDITIGDSSSDSLGYNTYEYFNIGYEDMVNEGYDWDEADSVDYAHDSEYNY